MRNMKNSTRRLLSISLFVLIYCLSIPLLSQEMTDISQWKDKSMLKYINKSKNHEINYVQKKPGHYSKEDWAEIIDATWGEGLPTSEKLEIFDRALDTLDQKFGAFFNININLNYWPFLVTTANYK